jgi:hypothetical protein
MLGNVILNLSNDSFLFLVRCSYSQLLARASGCSPDVEFLIKRLKYSGLAAAHRFFEPFYTIKSQGMGIGLAISRSIVVTHQGHLGETANARRGAVFHTLLG